MYLMNVQTCISLHWKNVIPNNYGMLNTGGYNHQEFMEYKVELSILQQL